MIFLFCPSYLIFGQNYQKQVCDVGDFYSLGKLIPSDTMYIHITKGKYIENFNNLEAVTFKIKWEDDKNFKLYFKKENKNYREKLGDFPAKKGEYISDMKIISITDSIVIFENKSEDRIWNQTLNIYNKR
jgi:hypothetical protein